MIGCGDPSCKDPNCEYGKEDDALRAEVRTLRADNDRLRAALTIIAGSADKLQALQATAALANIGAKLS